MAALRMLGSSQDLTVTWQVTIRGLEEGWHTSSAGGLELGSLATLKKVVGSGEPKIFAQLAGADQLVKGPVDRCLPEGIEARRNLQPQLRCHHVVDRNVNLLVTANVGCDGSDPDVTGEAKEGEEDEEDGSLEDGSLQDGMVGVVDPCLSDTKAGILRSVVGAVRVDHELHGLVVALFVSHVGLEGLDNTFGRGEVTSQPSGEEITYRQLQMSESKAAMECFAGSLRDGPC
jgi:hypothetical protein